MGANLMMPSPETRIPSLVHSNDSTNAAINAVRKAGVSVTVPRLAVWTVLAQADEPLQPYDIQARLNENGITLSLSSIYTVLKRFVEAGVLTLHAIDAGKSHYSLAEKDFRQHILCEESGRDYWLTDEVLNEAIEEFCRRHGFEPTTYSLRVKARPLDSAGDARKTQPT
ncbi:Fur family transcriptional regulator [Thauera butanivorans]|uniref:Fur family transcriptional regulator n=2 Tax=Thauera butanivorans TaxID=86174 RepID=UPI000838C232|nr:Fur family transcriptional regulator [Thauera butanivorans]